MGGKLRWSVLAVLVGCGYGRATPDSCHAKYVRDGKTERTGNNYETCMDRATLGARAEGLRELVTFETGCSSLTMQLLERSGGAATMVGVNACGRRLVYRRRLRKHLGRSTTKNTTWELVSAT